KPRNQQLRQGAEPRAQARARYGPLITCRDLEDYATIRLDCSSTKPSGFKYWSLWASPAAASFENRQLKRVDASSAVRKKENRAGVQSVARELQESIPTQEQTDMETSLFTSWTDTVDCGLLQEVLKLLASNQRRRQMLEAAQRIKETRRKQAEKPVGGRQLWLGPGSCQVRWRRQRHGARMRSHAPSTLVNNYWAAMLDAVMEEVPPEILRRVAAQTAAVYNRVHEDVTPSHLLALRIALRERATAADRDRSARQEQAGEREQNSTEESGARGEGSMEEEEEQQEPPKLSARRQGQIPHQKKKTLKLIQQEPVAMEPINIGETEPETNAANQTTQTGTRRRAAAEGAQDRDIARQDDWRQWLPRSQANDGDQAEQAGSSREA
ncbi:unnamed protein product, partial [Symbiodinium pilosum]